MTSSLERFQGCLLGVAVGDVLGLPHEGPEMRDYTEEELSSESLSAWERMMYTYLHSLYVDGDGKVREVPDLPGSFWAKGEYSDDTAETLAVVEGILKAQSFDMDTITQELVVWFDDGNARGLGGTTWLGLGLIKDGKATWRDAGAVAKTMGVIERSPWRLEAVPSNGSLMRTSPVGLYYCKEVAHNLGSIVTAAADLSGITHAFDECYDACWLLSELVSELAYGVSKQEALDKVYFMYKSIYEESMVRISLPYGHAGGVLETLGVALRSFECTDTFEEAILTAINPGGWLTDTDTYGSVTGALAGVCYGVEAIPDRWQSALNPSTGLTSNQIKHKASLLHDLVMS